MFFSVAQRYKIRTKLEKFYPLKLPPKILTMPEKQTFCAFLLFSKQRNPLFSLFVEGQISPFHEKFTNFALK